MTAADWGRWERISGGRWDGHGRGRHGVCRLALGTRVKLLASLSEKEAIRGFGAEDQHDLTGL